MTASPDRPLVFVTVGTDHHPFDRLIDWVDGWAADRGEAVHCVVQHGRSKSPVVAEARALIPPDELAATMATATVVVGHGGPGTIMAARDAGHVPIVVARLAEHGEVVDDHQVAFVARLAERGDVRTATDERSLRALLDRALAEPGAFRRDRGGDAEAAVATSRRFGTLVDGLFQAQVRRGPRIVYVAGWGRSGSTLLDRMLGQVPGVFSAGELRDVWQRGVLEDRRCGCGAPFSACEVWSEVGRRAFGGWDAADVVELQRLRERLDRPWTPPLLLGARTMPDLDRDVRRYVDALERLYLAIHEATGARVIVDSSKIPSYAMLLRRIPGVDLRVVHLVRDSRGVAFSWQKQVAREDGADPDQLHRYGTLPAAGRYLLYNASTHVGLRGVPRIFVRYEDLVRAPRPSLSAIFTHAGVPVDEESLAFLRDGRATLAPNHTVDGNPSRMSTGPVALREDDEWRTAMDPRRRLVVSAVTAPLLAKYGYRLRSKR